MYIIISTILLGLIFAGSLLGASKVLSKKSNAGGATTEELKTLQSKIDLFDKSIDSAIAHIGSLDPLLKLTEAEQLYKKNNDDLNSQKKIIKKLESNLQEMQIKVETAETLHNDLKKGKENSLDLATELQQNKARLESENSKLQDELANTINQLTVLSGGLNLTNDQEIGMRKIRESLSSATAQLQKLTQTFKQSSTRFDTLFGQFSDLEKEFTKLVEKQLSDTK